MAGGKGGSMHLVDKTRNVLGASAVVGTTIPLAVGYALAQKRMKTDNVSVASLATARTGRRVLRSLTSLRSTSFLCCSSAETTTMPSHADLAPLGVDAIVRAHRDLHAGASGRRRRCAEAARAYRRRRRARMRRGEGPAFIECQTYRWREHVGPNEDFDQDHRSRDDVQPWMKEDQVRALARVPTTAVPRSMQTSSSR